MVEFVNEAVLAGDVSNLTDRRADVIHVLASETQKINVPCRPRHRKAHAHQQKASLQDESFFKWGLGQSEEEALQSIVVQ